MGQTTVEAMSFKGLKRNGRHVLKTHYFVLFLMTLLLVAFGTGFSTFRMVKSFLNGSVEYESTIDKSLTSGDSASNEDIVEAILSGEYKTAREASEAVRNAFSNAVANSNKGILSSVVSSVSSGSFTTSLLMKINSLAKNEAVSAVIVVLIMTAVHFAIFFMIRNILHVFLARVYMEALTYKRVPFIDAIHVIRVRRWFRSAKTMFLKYVFQLLWGITIIGGVVKFFSYMMVPYIVAENPDIKSLEAITLSRRIMKGHKMEAFKLWISFIGWYLLSVFTLGILDIFFTYPYYYATFAGYYKELRNIAKENNVKGADRLNDEYLFVEAEEDDILNAYPDITENKEFLENNTYELKKVPAFLAKWFGIWAGSNAEKKKYEKIEVTRNRYEAQCEIANKERYPIKLNPLYHEGRKRFDFTLYWKRLYSIQSAITLFFIFCVVGWIYEVSLHLMSYGTFVNRGNLHGPWLPIYGFGGILILTVLKRLRDKPHFELIATVLICGTLEYSVAKFLEDVKLIRYWDYKGYFFNLDGRICLEGMIAFAMMAFIIVYLIAPFLDTLLSFINQKVLTMIAVVLVALFIGDVVWSSISPNLGMGVSEDLSLGGWPRTFSVEDKLNNMSDEDKETLRANIADVDVLSEFGIYPETLDELQEYRDNGLIDQLKKELSEEQAG